MNPRGGSWLLLLFLAMILAVVNASTWFVVSRVTTSLDEAVGLRLTTVASSAVLSATPELLLEPDVTGDVFVRGVLEEIATRHDLDDVFLVDAGGMRLLDLTGAPAGEREAFVDLDRAAFTRALAGSASASPAVEVDGAWIKAAYAPVEEWDGSIGAVLGVTAGGGFLARIPALRRTLLLISGGSAVVVALLGAVFFGMSRRLTAAESALARAETLGAMGMLAAGVAHEVRNPLSIIAGAASRLKRKYAGDPADPLFDFIPEEVDRLNRILEGYLRFARDEPLEPEPCDLREVAAGAARMVGEEFASRGITVRAPAGGDGLPVHADRHRLRQVLLNLLLNGCQAMPDGGELEMDAGRRGAAAYVVVRDRGQGFSREELAGGLRPFYTTKERGSGLGLAVARRIVEAHGGALRLANRDGGGAEATVEIPLRTGAAPEETA